MIAECFIKPSLVDLAYTAIKDDIVNGRLPPGEKINLRSLCERYGVSDTPIKQALNRLVASGIVITLPRKGMVVKEISWKEIQEVMEMRYMIESYCIIPALDAVRNNQEVRNEFSRNITENKRIIEQTVDLNNYSQASELEYKCSSDFHTLFVSCSNNNKIIDLYAHLGTHSYIYYMFRVQKEQQIMESLQEHEAIYTALMAGDEIALGIAVKEHIDKRAADVRKVLEINGKFNI